MLVEEGSVEKMRYRKTHRAEGEREREKEGDLMSDAVERFAGRQ